MKRILSAILLFTLLISSVLSSPLVTHAAGVCDIMTFALAPVKAILPAWVEQAIGLQRPWYNPSTCDYSNKVFGILGAPVPDDQMFGERYTYAQVNWISNSLLFNAPIIGAFFQPNIIDNIFKLLHLADKATPSDYANAGIIGLTLQSVNNMYKHPAASGIESISSTLEKFDLAAPAHAQGYGYTSLAGINVLWTASRNTAYLLMVILLLAVGFMVMFRIKVNPQTAVTLQLMIPRIIITLVLITFSYAIGGLVIDLVYVAISLFVGALSLAGVITNPAASLTLFTQPYSIFLLIIPYLFSIPLITIIPGVGPILALALGLIIVFLIFKIFWLLIKTYITLIAKIIFGPWIIMLGLLPGNDGFGGWFRSVIADASVFVVIPIMFILNAIIWNPFNLLLSVINSIPGVPAIDLSGFTSLQVITGQLPNLPLVWGQVGEFIFTLAIGYALLAFMPKTAEMIRDALKIKPFKHGSALGEAISPFIGIPASGAEYAAGVYKGKAGAESTVAGLNLVSQTLRGWQKGARSSH